MKIRKTKIILDTNLWISFLISNNFNEIDILIENNTIQLLFSNELIEEFLTVAKRPKFRKYFSNQDIEKLLNSFALFGKLIKVKSDIKKCRDIKDNFLLNLAIDGKANYLVTGDKDLLSLKKIGSVKIVSIKDFLFLIKNKH